jgi:hypothetical protein
MVAIATSHFAPGSQVSAPRRAVLLALVTLALGTGHVLAAADAMVYLYWDWGKSPKREAYQSAALILALQKTVPDYGPYRVVRVRADMTIPRLRREVHDGQRLNVHVGPWRDLDAGDPLERNYLISTPVMGGLMGYRRLIVRREDLPKFDAITSEAQLKKLVAGQGRGWVDVAVLRHNGYQVEDTGNLATLFEMLVNKRFDYLPISVIEAESALEQYPQLAEKLALAPNPLMYYPLPAVYYVSASQPRLAERLAAGLAAAKSDGSLDKLTARHFQMEIRQLKSSAGRCFILTNPLLPKIYAAERPLFLVN